MPSEKVNLIPTPAARDRFWDQQLTQQLFTEDGFQAIFVPTVGGSGTAWQNREIVFALETEFPDNKFEIQEIGAGILESVTTKRSSPLAVLKIGAISEPMKKGSAEPVKDGARWYENEEMSTVINRLMEQVYKDKQGNLPEDKRVKADLLRIETLDDLLGVWMLGTPPGFDGISFTPSPDVTPLTSLTVNADRTLIYAGIGGLGTTSEPELWEFDDSKNLWTKLATTSSADTLTQFGGIHRLFFNAKDKLIYGILWQDFGDTQAGIEADATNADWICPPARLFWWDPVNDSGFLNDSDHSKAIPNFWPGTWDVREMFALDSLAEIGVKKSGGVGPTVNGAIHNEAFVYKLDPKASVGNFSAFKYVHVPFAPVGQQGNPEEGDQERRRGVHRYHPQPSRNNYENDPLMGVWGNTLLNTAAGELIPETSFNATSNKVETTWAGATGITPPNGWTAITGGGAVPTFTVTAGVLTIAHDDPEDGMKITLAGLEDNMTVYRLRIDGALNFKLFVGNTDAADSVPYGPHGPVNSDPYSNAIPQANGDFYFSILKTDAIPGLGGAGAEDIHLRFLPVAPGTPITVNNLSLTVARHWDRWKDLNRQAGENIPLTGFGKIIAGVTVRRPTHMPGVGPSFELYDEDVDGISDRQNAPSQTPSSQRNEEVFLEFNFVGQDRRLIPSIGATAFHPMYGPSEQEDGISPDNSKRFVIGSGNILPAANTFNAASFSNEARIVDGAPHMTVTTAPAQWNGKGSNAADPADFQGGRAGHGYASVVAQAVGDRALDGTEDDNFSITGMIRYTNGQQGLFAFSQEADNGDGLILFAQFAGTKPLTDRKFEWGPTRSGRFGIKYSIFRCGTHGNFIDFDTGDTGGTGMMPTWRSLATQAPYITGGEEYVSIYPTAGDVDDAGNFYIGAIESHSQSVLFNGSNETSIHARSYIIKLAVGIGSFTVKADGASSYQYQSDSDASVYNNDGGGGTYGSMSDDYNGATGLAAAVNNTRKINSIFFNKNLTSNKWCAWVFRRDSLLSDPAGDSTPTVAIPCHELVLIDATVNKLVIIDHDVADGVNMDAAGFYGFTSTLGNFAPTKTDLGTEVGTWYFRLKKPAPNFSPLEDLGRGIQLCYYFNDSGGNAIGGQFWDKKHDATTSKVVYFDEAFLGNKQAVTVLLDLGLETERETIFSSFDHYLAHYQISSVGRKDLVFGSSRSFFRIDELDVDPILALFDFEGLKIFDAMAKLAQAHNFIFGFDVDKFFIVSKDLKDPVTYDISGDEGDIIDLEKAADNDIRNVISIQPYSPVIQDVDWEITHVGDDTVLLDLTLFNGDLILNIKTHKAVSLSLICTRKGRLIMDEFGEGGSEEPVDSITDPENRLIPLFKWRTSANVKTVVLLRTITATETTLFLNSVFASGKDPIGIGEIVIFTDPVTYEQIGRVITEIDNDSNKVIIEVGPGFPVDRLTPLTVVSANVGGSLDINSKSLVSNYSKAYSDEGVCVIQSITSGFPTDLIVNNVSIFRDFEFKPYTKEGYKHYSFLVTTSGSIVAENKDLPPGAPTTEQTEPTAWIASVDMDAQKITLNGDYSGFKVGDVLRIHYALTPPILIKQIEEEGPLEPPPYTGLIQDLPGGLASWHWVTDEVTDHFNVGDIISFFFKGIKLVKDSGALYTGVDAVSVSKYGQRPWVFPDNRFMPYRWVEHWVAKFLGEYGHPKYKVSLTIPFKDNLTFMNPAGTLLRKLKITDSIMFPNMEGFSVQGFIGELEVNLKNYVVKLTTRTEEKY